MAPYARLCPYGLRAVALPTSRAGRAAPAGANSSSPACGWWKFSMRKTQVRRDTGRDGFTGRFTVPTPCFSRHG